MRSAPNKRRLAEFFYARLLPRQQMLAAGIDAPASALMDFPQDAF